MSVLLEMCSQTMLASFAAAAADSLAAHRIATQQPTTATVMQMQGK